MRVIKKTFEQTSEHYNLISEYEIQCGFQNDGVEKGLSHCLNFPIRDVSTSSRRKFLMTESFEEIEDHLIKYDFISNR